MRSNGPDAPTVASALVTPSPGVRAAQSLSLSAASTGAHGHTYRGGDEVGSGGQESGGEDALRATSGGERGEEESGQLSGMGCGESEYDGGQDVDYDDCEDCERSGEQQEELAEEEVEEDEEDEEDGEEEEEEKSEGGALRAQEMCAARSRRRHRSRNAFIDSELAHGAYGDDSFADLEDFIVYKRGRQY